MKTIDQQIEALARELREEMPVYFIDKHELDERTMAKWILMNYRPPVEWEKQRDGFRRTLHKLRVTIAGQFIEYHAFMTDEAEARGAVDMKKTFRRHIRYAVGRRVMELLDPEDD